MRRLLGAALLFLGLTAAVAAPQLSGPPECWFFPPCPDARR